jgi:hypothetical protein
MQLPWVQERIRATGPPPPTQSATVDVNRASNISESARNAAKAELQAQLAHIDAIVAAARVRLPTNTSAMTMKEEVQRGIDEVSF